MGTDEGMAPLLGSRRHGVCDTGDIWVQAL